MKAPFPYFGGKSTIARIVWKRFGDVPNYVEPFFGSGAVLLARPGWTPASAWIETVNDADGFVSNFWRSLQAEPDQVARYADHPVNENDLHARHAWLVQNHKQTLPARLEGDPEYYDVKVAGWWVWGMSVWIGGGFCSGSGPWQSVDEDGQRQLVYLGDTGQGVQRKRVHLGNAGLGVQRQRVHLGAGRGVKRQLVHLSDAGQGENGLLEWMRRLSDRLRRVRVCCGDWSRVVGPSVTTTHGLTAVFLDPPYSAEAGRDETIYSVEDLAVAHEVREWAIANGENPLTRIALCGYDAEHKMPDSWSRFAWKAHGGYAYLGNGRGRENRAREVVWFSPHCLKTDESFQRELFAERNEPEVLRRNGTGND